MDSQLVKGHLQIELDNLLGGVFFEQHMFQWSPTEGEMAPAERQ